MGKGFQGTNNGTFLLQNLIKLTTLAPSTSLLKGNLAKIIVIMMLLLSLIIYVVIVVGWVWIFYRLFFS